MWVPAESSMGGSSRLRADFLGGEGDGGGGGDLQIDWEEPRKKRGSRFSALVLFALKFNSDLLRFGGRRHQNKKGKNTRHNNSHYSLAFFASTYVHLPEDDQLNGAHMC